MKKIIIPLLTLLVLIVSCTNVQFPYVTREEFDAEQAEKMNLRNSLDSLQRSYVKQTQDLNDILSEVASLSNRTSRITIEGGDGTPQSYMNTLKEDVAAIRQRIDRLEKEAASARKVNRDYAVSKTTISQLRQTISNQEKQILALQEKVSQQQQTIDNQSTRIRNQRDTISRQVVSLKEERDKLAKLTRQQTELLFRAGVQLSKIADEGDFKISGRRNRKNVADYRRLIYMEAMEFYRSAAEHGYLEAIDSMNVVSKRIGAL